MLWTCGAQQPVGVWQNNNIVVVLRVLSYSDDDTMKENAKKQFNLMDHMALYGIGLAVLYWTLEALVHVMHADDISFIQSL